jgi:phosphoribosylanthranilate isomerase
MYNKQPFIKMCGITRERDATLAADLRVNYLGFVFYQASPRYVSPQQAGLIIQGMQQGTTPVGLFVNHSAEEVTFAVQTSGVKVLQFHGTESPDFCEQISKQLNLPYWKAVHVSTDASSDDLLKLCLSYSSAQALLFDTASPAWGGTGKTFEWQKLAPLAALKNVPPLVLSGGLSAQNVAQGIALLSPWAVDVSSSIEAVDANGIAHKGIKNPTQMVAFVAAVRFTKFKNTP